MGLDAEVIPDLWGNQQLRQAAYQRVEELYELFLPQLAARLNEIHGTSYSQRYWRLVLGGWLYYYISILIDRHASLASAIAQYGCIKTTMLSAECYITPQNTLDAISLCMTDVYNLQIYSRILEVLGSGNNPKVRLEQKRASPTGSLRSLLSRALRKLVTRLLRPIDRGRIILHKSYFPRGMELLLTVRSGGKVFPSFIMDEAPPTVGSNWEMRHHLMVGHTSSGDEFESVLARLLPGDIPQCFVEGYANITGQTRAFPAAPRAILSANSWIFDEAFKQWSAMCAEAGTKLLCSQHGGAHTGIGTYVPYESLELSICDRYYSWGWHSIGAHREKIRVMPPAILAGRKECPADNSKTRILYVTTIESRYTTSMQCTSGNMVSYVGYQARFAGAVSAQIRRQVYVRLHHVDCGWDMRARWKDHAPEVNFDDVSVPFSKSMRNYRLLVCDHLGTTFYEALALNRPTIIFFDDCANPLRKNVIPVFDKLRKAGILHGTPEDAAKEVVSAYSNIEGWWNAPIRQFARRDFCQEFIRVSHDISAEWLKELEEIARNCVVPT